jgi:pretoxin HINT domain-containing protein
MLAAAAGVALGSTGLVVLGAVLLAGGIILITGGRAQGDSGGGVGEGSGSSGDSGGDSGGGLGTGGCFGAGTSVVLSSGSRAIERVEIGNIVVSRHENKEVLKEQRVSQTQAHYVLSTLLISFTNGEELVTTRQQRFCIKGEGFVPASKLRPGSIIKCAEGEVTIKRVERRNGETEIYNLQVDEYQTYFVGRNSVWVHALKINEPPDDDDDFDP